MTGSENVYTYRSGKKLMLHKKTDQFIVRALPEELEQKLGITDAKKVSASSSKITTRIKDLEHLMTESRQIAPTHHAYVVAETNNEFLITDRIFVTFHDPISNEEAGAFAGRYGLIILQKLSEYDYFFKLTEHTGSNPIKLIVKLTEQDPHVKSAEHDLNYRFKKYELNPPTDPSYIRQWHLHDRNQHADFDPRSSVKCETAWELLGSFGSADVVVGVADDGCKMDHADFASSNKFAGWGYFVGEDINLISDVDIGADKADMYKPMANHGTSCAGVIAADVNAKLTVGAAPGCRLLPIKWESEDSALFIGDSRMLNMLNYIADKVDILSNSWGSSPMTLWHPLVIRRIRELALTGGRRGSGIVFLWAAGNENCPIQHTTSIDVPYTSGFDFLRDGSPVWIGVKTSNQFQNDLVDIPGVMHIAALSSNAQRSHYSNYGTGITLCAPSSNSHEYHRLPVKGLGITTSTGQASSITNTFGGTSSATPLVAGVAALIISANPSLTALNVVQILKNTASKDLNFEGYPTTPPASYDSDTSWDVSPVAPFDKGDFQNTVGSDETWSPWFGHGRVDAHEAVAEALRLRDLH
ncbi:S8 family serine peptidase [Paenibacillus illinoisensis]|uniref:S8 family serine peptidase n=1 Tax=Paenibacillus illinoisensis TaxID=59845 RepID=UPI001C8EF3A9|nr:S8 family serine peptidase [Paenibacillus illinoisensis]MBY0217875.1 S8 family serine peptidase [Paenibacillus illinoisensis]